MQDLVYPKEDCNIISFFAQFFSFLPCLYSNFTIEQRMKCEYYMHQQYHDKQGGYKKIHVYVKNVLSYFSAGLISVDFICLLLGNLLSD